MDPTAAKVYTSTELAPRQEPWIVFHEIGHAAIEWHRDLLYLDTEYTLSPRVRGQLEREANEFAGHLRFLGPRFEAEARELPFGVPSVLTLNERYDALDRVLDASLHRDTGRDVRVQCLSASLCTLMGSRRSSSNTLSGLSANEAAWKFPYTVGQCAATE